MTKRERERAQKVLLRTLGSYQSFRDSFQWDESPQARRETFLRQKKVIWLADCLAECGLISWELWEDLYEQADMKEEDTND